MDSILIRKVYKLPKNILATTKFLAPEGSKGACSILKTHNSAVTCEPRCYLAPSASCTWTDTRFCMCGKNCINYAEILCSQTTRRLDFVPPCLMRLLTTFTANTHIWSIKNISSPSWDSHYEANIPRCMASHPRILTHYVQVKRNIARC